MISWPRRKNSRQRRRDARRGRERGRGRILAVKWGLNPNSSSLGVDVTFFLFGATALALTTPLLSALIRWKKPLPDARPDADLGTGPDTDAGTGPDTDARDE